MAILETIIRTTHVFAGGLLAGSVVFFTWATLQNASTSGLDPAGIAGLADQLTNVSRFCAVLLLISGGYMAMTANFGANPTYDGLLGLMILLWLVVTALVEVGNSKLQDGAGVDAVRTHYLVAALSGALLLVDAGLVASL